MGHVVVVAHVVGNTKSRQAWNSSVPVGPGQTLQEPGLHIPEGKQFMHNEPVLQVPVPDPFEKHLTVPSPHEFASQFNGALPAPGILQQPFVIP